MYTMKDFRQDFQRAQRELEELGYHLEDGIILKFNARTTTSYGRCTIDLRNELITIELMTTPISFLDREEIYNTILHECVHSLRQCWNCHHTGNWKRICNHLNSYYGYDLQRTKSNEGLSQYLQQNKKPNKYIITCQGCGHSWERQKMSKIVSHPQNYRCQCGGRLTSSFLG